jgi:hypothetical protein
MDRKVQSIRYPGTSTSVRAQGWRSFQNINTAGPPAVDRILLIEQRNVLGRRSLWPGLQIRIDIDEFLIGKNLARVRRHLARGLMDVFDERFERKLRRADARPGSLGGALAFAPVAFVAAIFGEGLFAGFRVARLSRCALFARRSRILRSRRGGRKHHCGDQRETLRAEAAKLRNLISVPESKM